MRRAPGVGELAQDDARARPVVEEGAVEVEDDDRGRLRALAGFASRLEFAALDDPLQKRTLPGAVEPGVDGGAGAAIRGEDCMLLHVHA